MMKSQFTSCIESFSLSFHLDKFSLSQQNQAKTEMQLNALHVVGAFQIFPRQEFRQDKYCIDTRDDILKRDKR